MIIGSEGAKIELALPHHTEPAPLLLAPLRMMIDEIGRTISGSDWVNRPRNPKNRVQQDRTGCTAPTMNLCRGRLARCDTFYVKERKITTSIKAYFY